MAVRSLTNTRLCEQQDYGNGIYAKKTDSRVTLKIVHHFFGKGLLQTRLKKVTAYWPIFFFASAFMRAGNCRIRRRISGGKGSMFTENSSSLPPLPEGRGKGS